MTTISPTIGRKVWFHPGKADRGMETITKTEPMDASVVYVWSDTLVNLAVWDHYGNIWARSSVRLVQPGDAASGDEAWCEWMPYQIGQAERHATQDVGAGQVAQADSASTVSAHPVDDGSF